MSGGRRATALGLPVAALALAAAGCGLLDAGSVSSASCAGMPGGACSEQVELLERRHPGATAMDLECRVPVCDRRSGQGTVVITMRDGTRVSDTFAYVGDPGPVPQPACANLPPDVCRSVATSQVDEMPPSQRIAAISATCTVARCTPAEGTASVAITLGDGVTQATETSWSGAPP